MSKEVHEDGTICYYNGKGELHKKDGPAIVIPTEGIQRWYIDGVFLFKIEGEEFARGATEWRKFPKAIKESINVELLKIR
jgi:hypothetical protein